MLEVRRASRDDTEWLLGELRANAATIPSRHEQFPEDKYARDFLRTLIDDHYVIVAVGDSGDRQGFLAAIESPYSLNPNLLALTELFWWVRPSARGGLAGGRLFKAFDEYGRAHAQRVAIGHRPESPLRGTALVAAGYRLDVLSYVKEVVNGN